jgi:hypothetical protein
MQKRARLMKISLELLLQEWIILGLHNIARSHRVTSKVNICSFSILFPLQNDCMFHIYAL